MKLEELQNYIKNFVNERDWSNYHSAENLAKSIAIEAGELLECFQWSSNANMDDVKDELADVFIYCLQMADSLNLDILEISKAKMEKNAKKYPVEKCKGLATKYDKLDSVKIYCYPKCSTCQKAIKFLDSKNIKYQYVNIKEDNPNKEELFEIYKKSNLPIGKLFNTSGNLYKEMNIKEKIKEMTIDEAIELLSTNGMLVKRPILLRDDLVLVGFKEEEYEKL